MSLVDHVREAGVVGAGGAGFPTHVKLAGRAEMVIANGAECEPLLHKDAAVMEHRAAEVVRGLLLAMEAVGAGRGVIGVKEKNHAAVAALREAVRGTAVQLHLLGDYYPTGDEYDLVYSVTGRLVPPAGIPLQVGVVVCNVETLINVAAAVRGEPVLEKTLTVTGAVAFPVTVTVPVGTSYREVLSLAGGPTTPEPILCVGGVMMGEWTDDLDRPVTKTCTGLVVLPRSHSLVTRKFRPVASQNAIGRSACDQCRYCTEYCPRYLLGYPVEPHQVMRALGFTANGESFWHPWAALCCGCGLCTWYACPEQLYPKEACDQARAEMRRAGRPWRGPAEVRPHPMREGRRVPTRSLVRRLGLEAMDRPAPRDGRTVSPGRVIIPLKQHAGVPCIPTVAVGDQVRRGQPLGRVPEGRLGAPVHASVDGRVVAVGEAVIVEAIP